MQRRLGLAPEQLAVIELGNVSEQEGRGITFLAAYHGQLAHQHFVIQMRQRESSHESLSGG